MNRKSKLIILTFLPEGKNMIFRIGDCYLISIELADCKLTELVKGEEVFDSYYIFLELKVKNSDAFIRDLDLAV